MFAMPILSRLWPYLALGVALVGAMLWLDQRGYQRATDDRAKADAAMLEKIGKKIGDLDTKLSGRIADIDTTERTVVQPILTREIARDPRYRDPAAGVSPDVLRALNTARAATCPDGGDCRSVPAVAPDR